MSGRGGGKRGCWSLRFIACCRSGSPLHVLLCRGNYQMKELFGKLRAILSLFLQRRHDGESH